MAGESASKRASFTSLLCVVLHSIKSFLLSIRSILFFFLSLSLIFFSFAKFCFALFYLFNIFFFFFVVDSFESFGYWGLPGGTLGWWRRPRCREVAPHLLSPQTSCMWQHTLRGGSNCTCSGPIFNHDHEGERQQHWESNFRNFYFFSLFF